MPARIAHLAAPKPSGELEAALLALREKNDVPEAFPDAVTREAEAAAPALPPLDLRQVPFVTLDPPGSKDLDQAFHIERANGGGFVLRYAIADLPAFVLPLGAVDTEARGRGQTIYLPDGRVPLHPPVLSEDRASLLPEKDRGAFVWTIPVDGTGAAAFEGAKVSPARVGRAVIRSRQRLDYESAQHAINSGSGSGRDRGETGGEQLALLREFGLLRIEQERLRGGASLNMADEEVVRDEDGYRLVREAPLAVEDWNAQLSLLTGMVAARMMLDGGIGILRTMPLPDAAALEEFRTATAALGMPWSAGVSYGDFLRNLPRDEPRSAAVLHAAARLFRGSGYTVFGVPDAQGLPIAAPTSPDQAAIAAPYAHVTAPLRRLVDRWGLVICEALCSGSPVPEWATSSLSELPAIMRASSSLVGRLNAAGIDRVEAALLRDLVGTGLSATVLEVTASSARVQLDEPPVTAQLDLAAGTDPPVPGERVEVFVSGADVASGSIELELNHPNYTQYATEVEWATRRLPTQLPSDAK